MSDVFLSYKREDEARVGVLRHALERGGLDVWWDRDIPGGEQWRPRILSQLEAAKCVIVVWSEASAGEDADFVRDEAARAKQRGTLLPVRIDDVVPPLGFGEQQALDLVAWNGDEADVRLEDVVAAAKALIAGGPLPAPQGPRSRKAIAWAAGKFAIVAAVIGFAVNLATGSGLVCQLPGINALCGAAGIGGAPSREEGALWSKRRPGDCGALRAYLSKFPHGTYAAEAQARLAAADVRTNETWMQEERRLPLVVRSTLDAFPNKQAAQADALARGSKDATAACVGYDQKEFQLLSARAVTGGWRCSERLGGYVCGFDGEAVCEVRTRRADRSETCR